MDANGMDPTSREAMTAAERGRRVARALEVSSAKVFANEVEAEILGPLVDRIDDRYGEISKAVGFAEAGVAARGELVAEAIGVAEELAEARAVARCRRIVETATVTPGGDAEAMRRLLLAALDPVWDRALDILSQSRGCGERADAAHSANPTKAPNAFVGERPHMGDHHPPPPYQVRDTRDGSLLCRTWRGSDASLVARLMNEELVRDPSF